MTPASQFCHSWSPWRLSSWPPTSSCSSRCRAGRWPGARRHPDLGRLHLSLLLSGHRPRQPPLRPGVARRIVFVGFMLAVVCSIVVPPLLFRFG